jgi:fatty-acyl-CoA synthase
MMRREANGKDQMSRRKPNRTLVEAIQDLEHAPSRGFFFLEDAPGGSIAESYVSFPDLARDVTRRAGALQAADVRRGDRLPIIVSDTREFITSFLGAVLAGIVPVPIYPPAGIVQLHRYMETILAIVRRSGAKVVLTTEKLNVDLAASGLPFPSRMLTTHQLETSCGAFHDEDVRFDDIAFLQYTSGSTSYPKGVCVTHANIASNSDSIQTAFRLTTDDVPVSWLPLYHDMGLIGFLLTPVYATVSTRFMPTQMFLRRPGSWMRAMSSHRATISVAPNFAFAHVARRLKDEDVAKLDLSAWRIAGCGAEPIRPADLEAFATKLAPAGFRSRAFLPMYGLAEATLAVTIPEPDTGLMCCSVDVHKLRAEKTAVLLKGAGSVQVADCGPALPANQIAIFALDDDYSVHPLDEGKVGEIRIRGPNVMSGYWNDVSATRSAFAGRFLRTGDLGFLHQGRLHVCGRTKELIIVNGRNYFPDEIERAVRSVPGLRVAMAFQTSPVAVNDSEGSQLVIAAEAAAPDKIDLKHLHHAVSTEVGLSVNDVVLVAPGSLPKTSSGKLRRREACRLYEAGMLQPARIPAKSADTGNTVTAAETLATS